MTENLIEAARQLYATGIVVLPALKAQKRPVGAWKKWTKTAPSFDEVFRPGLKFDAICVVCGAVSGGLEILDFDQKAAKFDEWSKLVGDVSKFAVETTQSGGKHLAFRSDCCAGNQKLATNASGVTVETRGEGGICLIAPTDGYKLVGGDWLNVPTLDASERDRLLNAARSLNESTASRPTDGENRTKRAEAQIVRGDVAAETTADFLRENLQLIRDALRRKGWELLRVENEYEYWKRPGQEKPDRPGGSLNVETGNFHCFTSNAPPLATDGNYTPLQLVAALEHGGDVSAASRAYSRYKPSTRISRIDCFNPFDVPEDGVRLDARNSAEGRTGENYGGATWPKELLECGGLIQEFQDLANEHAFLLQPEGAFLSAFATVSYLIGRSVAISVKGNLTTPNVYALFLAPSGTGKEAVRRIGVKAAQIYEPSESIPESFASVQALQNIIARRKKILWLHDEFGRDLKVMASDRTNSNVTNIITEVLKLYTSADSRAYLPKMVAQEAKGVKKPTPVDRPSLTIFATGNPREFFEAASEALLTNGYLARLTTVVGRSEPEEREISYEEAREAKPFEIYPALRARIEDWNLKERRTTGGFELVDYTRDAYVALKDFGAEVAEEKKNFVDASDGVQEFLSRLIAKAWKYALIFTASRYGAKVRLVVDDRQARLAIALARYEKDVFLSNIDRYGASGHSRLGREILDWALAIGGEFSLQRFTRKFQRKPRRDREEALMTLIDGAYVARVDVRDTDGTIKNGFRVL
jgi:hypothetical protein